MPRTSPQLVVSLDDHLDHHPLVMGLTDRQFRVLITALVDHGAGRSVVIPGRSRRGLLAAGLIGEDDALTEHATQWIGRTTRADRRRSIPADVRTRVFARDGWACVNCASLSPLHLDHIRPWSKGGSDDEANLQVLCASCNLSKGARTP